MHIHTQIGGETKMIGIWQDAIEQKLAIIFDTTRQIGVV